jgi:hypothetical protein
MLIPRGSIARGLLLAYNGAFPRLDLISKRQASAGITGDINQKPGVFGKAAYNPATLAGTSRTFTGYTGGTSHTVMAVVQDNIGRGAIRTVFSSDFFPSPRIFQLRFSATDLPEVIWFDTVPNAFTVAGAITSPASGRIVLAGRQDGTALTVWMNGVNSGSGTITGTPQTIAAANVLGIGNNYRNNTQVAYFQSDIYGVYLWNRALTDAEMVEIGQNPDIMFAPIRRRKWMSAGPAAAFIAAQQKAILQAVNRASTY